MVSAWYGFIRIGAALVSVFHVVLSSWATGFEDPHTKGIVRGGFQAPEFTRDRVSRQPLPKTALPAFDTTSDSRPLPLPLPAAYVLAQQSTPAGSVASTETPSTGHNLKAELQSNRVSFTSSGRTVAEFVFRDSRILRPYFANVHTPAGFQATRQHPPVPEKDAVDHDTMHPGIWFGFGDLGGADFWRNKASIVHREFLRTPEPDEKGLRFSTLSEFRKPDQTVIGIMTNHLSIRPISNAWLIAWDADIKPIGTALTFGDQEEMGFGARVATGITEKAGGTLISSAGLKSAQATWGQEADWCDYSGVVDGRRTGITLFADPHNFRGSWWHNRDYGVFVANPFGRKSMKQGDPSRISIEPDQWIRLAFGAAIHDGTEYSPSEAHRSYVSRPDKSSQMTILGWHSIPEKHLSEERYRELAEMGLTHSLMHYSPAGCQKALDAAAKVGVRLFLEDPRFLEKGESVARAVAEYRDHPALAGYVLRDEPSLPAFAELAAARDALKALDSRHWSYVNLLPTYASPAQLGTDSYPTHLRRFLIEFRPEVLSFDHYPILEGDRVRSDYFQNLEWMRQESTAFGVPFWAFALACPHKPYPMPTLAHVRFQAWCNFAYGAKALQYFTYWNPTPGTWDFHDAPIRQDGTRSPTYELLRQFNQDVQACAKVLLQSRVVGVWHSAPLPQGTRPVDDSCPFQKPDGGPVVIGLHTLPNGARYALVVNRSITTAIEWKFTAADWIRSVDSVHAIRGSEFLGMTDRRGSLRLEAGAGALLRIR